MRVCVCMYIYTYNIYIYTHIYMYLYIYIYIYIFIHVYTCWLFILVSRRMKHLWKFCEAGVLLFSRSVCVCVCLFVCVCACVCVHLCLLACICRIFGVFTWCTILVMYLHNKSAHSSKTLLLAFEAQRIFPWISAFESSLIDLNQVHRIYILTSLYTHTLHMLFIHINVSTQSLYASGTRHVLRKWEYIWFVMCFINTCKFVYIIHIYTHFTCYSYTHCMNMV